MFRCLLSYQLIYFNFMKPSVGASHCTALRRNIKFLSISKINLLSLRLYEFLFTTESIETIVTLNLFKFVVICSC